MNKYHYKFEYDEKNLLENFVNNGYVLLKNIHDPELIKICKNFFSERIEVFLKEVDKGNLTYDMNGFAAAIIDEFEKTDIYLELIEGNKIVSTMQSILGKDLAIFNQDALWINTPNNKDPVLNKNIHTDAWTGTSVNTIFCKTFFTDVDKYNGMTVYPGSHLYGLTPVKNRSVDTNIMSLEHLKEINLDNASRGDVLIWHALLLHKTTGQSDINTRISLTSRYTSTETKFSSQERSLGYRTLSVSPLNQILRLIGSDTLQPMRTYGGFVGIDRRLKKLYGYSSYKTEEDYSKYLNNKTNKNNE